ncbi:MAG: TIGR03936 family radical SAM-associated protein [Lachnospiraceae bacterium]|nr:TIGR03936 family radical SAM-associated protein [Lachnospiraceae bacterium]
MQDSQAVKYRVKFSKKGALRYISHLDVMRYFQKVIRRAEIPVKYSEGFSPHQLLSFAYPLSLGYTSDGEYLDMVMTERVNEEEALRRLNECSESGIKILAVKELDEKARNCMACVFAASYNITIREKITLPDDFCKKVIDFFGQETIPVNKPKKKNGGSVLIDLKQYLYDFRMIDDRTFYICVNSGSETNIRPDFVAGSVCEYCNVVPNENPFYIHRVEIYENISDNENVELRALI